MQHYFGVRLIDPVGRWEAAGPYDTYEEAKITYFYSETQGRYLSPPFVAESKGKAESLLARQSISAQKSSARVR